MTSPVVLPVPGFEAKAILDQDRMAAVWLAADQRNRSAILTIGHRVLVDEADRAAFLGWAETLSRVATSPGIADVLAHGLTADGRPYQAVETATSTLADQVVMRAITPSEARVYGLALSQALATAHAAGLSHGAVRPATILLTGKGPMLSGFSTVAPGLGQALALDEFTPPEHIGAASRGALAASTAGDIYDLASTLVVALGGQLPWAPAPDSIILRNQQLSAITGVSPPLLELLQTATATDPAIRPSATDLHTALSALDPGERTEPIPAVSTAAVGTSTVRRVAISTIESVGTGFGGAVGGAIAAKMLGTSGAVPPTPASTVPPATPPPVAAPQTGGPAGSPPVKRAAPRGHHQAGRAARSSGSTAGNLVAAGVVIVIVIVVVGVANVVRGHIQLPGSGPGNPPVRAEQAEIVGTYGLSISRIDPERPGEPGAAAGWDGAVQATHESWERDGLTIRPQSPGCTGSNCTYVMNRGLVLSPVGDGTFRASDSSGVTYTLRPTAIEHGRVASLDLSLTVTILSEPPSALTITLTGTRTG